MLRPIPGDGSYIDLIRVVPIEYDARLQLFDSLSSIGLGPLTG